MKADQHDFTPVLEAQVNNGKRQGVEQTVAELAANGIGSIIAGTDTASGRFIWTKIFAHAYMLS
jgi:hypothetical protein